MSNAVTGPGFLLQKGDGGTPENFTTITEVKDIKGPGIQLDTVDVTNQSSPNNFEEVLPTIKRGSDVTFVCHFQPDDATHNATTGIMADLLNRTLRDFRLLIPGKTQKFSWSAYVTKFEPSSPVVGVMTADVTLKIATQPQLA